MGSLINERNEAFKKAAEKLELTLQESLKYWTERAEAISAAEKIAFQPAPPQPAPRGREKVEVGGGGKHEAENLEYWMNVSVSRVNSTSDGGAQNEEEERLLYWNSLHGKGKKKHLQGIPLNKSQSIVKTSF